MIKVLILAYDFPPYVSVGGLRPYSWYKYFRKTGTDPVVVTRQWSNQYGNHLDYIAPGEHPYTVIEQTEFGTIIRSPYKPNLANRMMLKYGDSRFRWFRKIISAWYEFWQWFFIIGPKAGLYRAADDYLKRNTNKVDAIIATGDPFVLFKYASKLSKKYNIPWIADYRDPWSNNYEKSKFRSLHRFFISLEKKYVHTASAITTVSEFLKYKLAQLHPHLPIYILPNGYDPEAIAQAKQAIPPTDRLRFGFVGTIYDWHPWKSVLKVFENFRKSEPGAAFEINFYGINKQDELEEEINLRMPQLSGHIRFFRRMPNDILLKELAGNHVMLLFNYYAYMGTKIFDYLGLRRFMLLCYSQDAGAMELKQRFYAVKEEEGFSSRLQADLIEHTCSGLVVRDSSHLFEALGNLFQEFKTTGNIACRSVHVEEYSREHQVRKLAEIISLLP